MCRFPPNSSLENVLVNIDLHVQEWKCGFGGNQHTGVLLNFNAVCPEQWKTGLILCLLKRAKTICSTDNIFWTEVKNLQYMFRANGYPKLFFDKCVQKFLKIKAPQLKYKENVNEEKLFHSRFYLLECRRVLQSRKKPSRRAFHSRKEARLHYF